MKLKVILDVIEKDSRIVLINGKLKLLDKPVASDSNVACYSLVLTDEDGKTIASTIENKLPSPPDSWIELIVKAYEKQGSIPECLEVEEVSSYINLYKETIPLDVLVTFFNEHGEYKGFRLVKNYSLEDVRKLCLNAFYEGAENEKHGLTFEDWCKNNL